MWPALSECFDLHPWDVERLSRAELIEYVHRLPEALARKTFELKVR